MPPEGTIGRYKRHYWQLVNAGLCTRCGKAPPVKGKRMCESCAANHRRARNDYNHLNAKLNSSIHKYKYEHDEEYRRKKLQNRTDYENRKKALGLCIGCGGEKDEKEKLYCAICRAKQHQRYEKRKARRKAADQGMAQTNDTGRHMHRMR